MHNFNDIETVYEKNLVTVCLKRRPEFVASPEREKPIANSPEAIYRILKPIFSELDHDQEHLVMLILNVRNEVEGFRIVASGMRQGDPKVIFRHALMLGAAKIALAHNDTNGFLKPGREDVAFTKAIIEVGRIMDLPLVDHVVYAESGYLSMRAEKVCRFELFV